MDLFIQSWNFDLDDEVVYCKLQEKFIEQFSEDGYAQCVKDRKKSLSYQHLGTYFLHTGEFYGLSFLILLLFSAFFVGFIVIINVKAALLG